MAPNLSEEQQVIIVISYFGASTPKGLHSCYVPTAYIDMCYKNIEKMKPKWSVSTKVKILFQPYIFFTRCFIIRVAGYLI